MADTRTDRRKTPGRSEYRTAVERPNSREELALALVWLWREHGTPEALVCIGTDRATGDALGPLVGTQLQQKAKVPFHIHGTLEHPIHATNLHDLVLAHPRLTKSRVLAIDASLGRPEEVGAISLGLGAIRPGAGVNKELPAIGRYYMTGTVNIGGFMDYYVLQNTRLALVMRMAHTIADAIQMSLRL